MGDGFSLGRVFGIRILLDPSLLIIFALVTASLGAGLFPAWHAEWSALTSWLTAAVAAVLFFLSVLVHELSHALVGRRVGVDVQRITLFVFGGLAQLEGEPRSWRAEFAIAVVGPLTSLALAALFLGAGMAIAGGTLPPTGDAAAAEAFVRQLGAPATLLFWLGPINAILALFNLVPGFPLDGGRMLRALLWGALGSLRRATRYAATLGQGFAWLLIAAGVAMALGWSVPVFGEGLVGGLWLAFIGWFLNGAAVMSYRQLVARETLEDVPVSRIAADDYDPVSAALPLDRFVDQHLLRSEQRVFPVIDNGLVGVVGLPQVREVPRDRWGSMSVADVMTPVDRLRTVDAGENAARVLETLTPGDAHVPVVEGTRFRGFVRREDFLKWIALAGASPAQA